ncbi:MAG: hypothetical protein M3530_10420 [Thermoproteota archaeon]|nr:hypothetical protein [Thermoproteota archaeon]
MRKGSEIYLLSVLARVTIVFGSFGIYVAVYPNPDTSIHNLYGAIWWAIETITTVARPGIDKIDCIVITVVKKWCNSSIRKFNTLCTLTVFIWLVDSLAVNRMGL